MKLKVVEENNKFYIQNQQLDGTKYLLQTLYPKYERLLLLRSLTPSYEPKFFKRRELAEKYIRRVEKIKTR